LHDRLQDLIEWVSDRAGELKKISIYSFFYSVYWSPLCLFVLVLPEEERDIWANCFGGDTPEGWPGTLINMAVMYCFIYLFYFTCMSFGWVTRPFFVVEKTNPKCGHVYEGSLFDSASKPPPFPCDSCLILKVMAETDWPPWRSADTAETESAVTEASDSE